MILHEETLLVRDMQGKATWSLRLLRVELTTLAKIEEQILEYVVISRAMEAQVVRADLVTWPVGLEVQD